MATKTGTTVRKPPRVTTATDRRVLNLQANLKAAMRDLEKANVTVDTMTKHAENLRKERDLARTQRDDAWRTLGLCRDHLTMAGVLYVGETDVGVQSACARMMQAERLVSTTSVEPPTWWQLVKGWIGGRA